MLTEYKSIHEESLIEAYIETFSGEPWNEVWEPDWVLNRVRWVSNVPNFTGLVAIQDDEVVGALLGYAKPFKDKLDFEILELFVLPSFQGKGIGKSLIKELESRLSNSEFSHIHLLTAIDSESELFYKKLNYVRNEKLSIMVHRK